MVTPLLYGLYAGGVSIAIMLLTYFTGMWQNDAAMWIGYIAYIFLFYFIWKAMLERKQEDYGGTITYGQCVGTGTMVGLFAGLLVAIFMWVYLNNINPEFQTTMVTQKMKDMQEMPAAQREQAISMMDKFFVPFAIFGSVFANVLFALIGSLIIAIFVRTKPEEQGAMAG